MKFHSATHQSLVQTHCNLKFPQSCFEQKQFWMDNLIEKITLYDAKNIGKTRLVHFSNHINENTKTDVKHLPFQTEWCQMF